MQHRGKIIGDAPCPGCRAKGRDSTGNHLILFDNGGAYCNRCGYTERRHAASWFPVHLEEENNNMTTEVSVQDYLEYPIRALPHRGIRKEVAEHFQVRVALSETDGQTITSTFYPVFKNKSLSAFHIRMMPKTFTYAGDAKGADLWGLHASHSGKTLYITEGREDCMALYQCLRDKSSLTDWHPAVISIGGSHAHTVLAEHMDIVDQYEKLVFVLDNDEAGKDTLTRACQVFPHKSFVVTLPLKDPNDMLLTGRGEELYWLCMKPKKYQPDNIIDGADTWDIYLKNRDSQCYPYPAAWTDLNSKTYGIRPGSIVTIASGSGSGKTQFMRELKYHYHLTTDFKFADIALEEGISDTVGGMMALHLNKRIQLPDVQATDDELRSAHDFLYSTHRWSLYDHFGGMDDESLFTKLRYFAATGHKIIYLDHLSIIVSEYAAQGGERERIDTIMTKLAKIVKEFGIVLFLVVHLKKAAGSGQSFEEGCKPSLDDLRGSGSIKQLSWDVLFLTRNQQHPDPFCANTSLISVGKCRFTGRTGDADYLNFQDRTGRMIKVAKPTGWDLKELEKQERRARF
jgi:twinkle protein